MKQLILILGINLLVISAQAQVLNMLSCSSGGFAYNNLDVIYADNQLIFSTDGNGLFFDSNHLAQGDRIINIAFSISQENCDLANILNGDLTCSASALPITLRVRKKGEKTIGTIKDEMKNISLILKKVPSNHFAIKLLLLQSSWYEKLILSNSFKSCQ